MHKKSWDEDDSQKEMIQNKIETYSPMVYRLAYALVKSRVDADDIHQEVFLRYLKYQASFENAEHEKAWFLRVAINISKNLVTSGWKRKVIYDDEQLRLFADEAVAQDNTGDSDDNSEAVLKAVLALPKNLSVVIQLFYYEEYSVAQIADLLDISVGNVTTRLNRARKKLEKSLREV